MTDYEPILPTLWDPQDVSTAEPRNFQDPGILYPNLPSATKSYRAKYRPNNPYQQQLDPIVYKALQDYDKIRVQQGKSPISESKSAKAAISAQTKQAVTPEPEKNLLEAGMSDLTNLVTSLPRLPGQLVTEAKRLGTLSDEMAKIQKQQGVGQELAGYLQLPGVNLIPGTYTASNVLSGNTDEMLDHPLFTALDVLPYANKLAKATPVAKAAREAQVAETLARAEQTGLPAAIPHQNALRDVLTKKVGADGVVEANAIGRSIDGTLGVLGQTRPGQFIQDAFSPTSRESSRIYAEANKRLRDRFNPSGRATNDPVTEYVRQVNSIRSRFPDIDEATSADISRRITNPVDDAGNPIAIKDMGFNGSQLAYAYELKDLADRSTILAEMDTGLSPEFELAQRDWVGGQETFTKSQAKRIDELNRRREQYQSRSDSRQSAYDYIRRTFDPNDTSPTMMVGGIEVPNPTAAPELNALIDQMKTYRRGQGPLKADATQFLNHISRGRYSEAQSVLNRINKTKRWVSEVDQAQVQGAIDTLTNVREMKSVYDKYSKYTPQRAERFNRMVDDRIRRITPARFGEMEQSIAKKTMAERVQYMNPDDPMIDAYLAHIDNGNYASLIDEGALTSREYLSIQREVKQQVAALKEAGADPVFLHRVSPDKARATAFPKVSDKTFTPSSLRDRTLDTSPYIDDLSVALSHQALEFLGRQAADEYVRTIDRAYGQNINDLRAEYLPHAVAAKEANPQLNINAYIDAAMKKDGWVKFDTEKMIPWAKKTGTTMEALDGRMIPGSVARNIERVQSPPKLIAAIDPVMNAFRTSVLALSPRWLANNIIGGAFLLGGEVNPIKALGNIREAYRMVKSGDLHDIPGISEGALDIAPEEVMRVVNAMSDADKVGAIYQHSVGRKMRALWDNAQVMKARQGGAYVIEKSYKFNQWMDDFYRAMAYLTDSDKALTKGMSAAEAQNAGIATARKIMQNWDEITPIERTVLRYIFPFYGFMQHVTRYVMRYPFDHPWRTAVLGSFARNEMEDMGSGLPQRFLSFINLGDQDENGNQKALTLGGANPFANVASMWTLGGMLSATNPFISSMAESLGIDPTSGSTEMYPNVRYNPDTGRLEAEQKNYIQTLLGNVVPMYNLGNDVLFDNARFNQLRQTNPGAAARQIMAQTGLPILTRGIIPGDTYNPTQETMKAELARIEAQDRAKGEMLRTGNYEIADKYPGLNGYLAMLMEKQGELEKYKVPEGDVDAAVSSVRQSAYRQATLPAINFSSGG